MVFCITLIECNSKLYEQAVQLRYDIFYRPLGLSITVIHDPCDALHFGIVDFELCQLIGYGQLVQTTLTSLQIRQMAIAPHYQCQGYGTRLLNTLIKVAMLKKAELVHLNAKIGEIDFYRKAGFRSTGDLFVSPETGCLHSKMSKQFGAKWKSATPAKRTWSFQSGSKRSPFATI